MSHRTELCYLKNPFEYTAKAKVIAYDQDDHGPFVELDRTFFYPQGGGQPADKGILQGLGQSVEVSFVISVEGRVRHYGKFSKQWIGEPVQMEIDTAKRREHSRLHTAGHLVSHVIENLYPKLRSIKGYHFPDSPYVEIAGDWEIDDKEETLNKINQAISECLSQGGKIKTSIEPDVVNPIRRVQLPQFDSVPCGGTHTETMSEVKGTRVTKLKKKRGNYRVSYTLE